MNLDKQPSTNIFCNFMIQIFKVDHLLYDIPGYIYSQNYSNLDSQQQQHLTGYSQFKMYYFDLQLKF